MILELKDKLRKLELDLFDSDEFCRRRIPLMLAVSALMVLGYRNEEQDRPCRIGGRTEDDSLETVILKALKTMKV